MRLENVVVLFMFMRLRWLCSQVVSVLDSGAEGPGFKSQLRHCRVTVLGRLFTPVMPLFIVAVYRRYRMCASVRWSVTLISCQ